ncbi:aminopeptidase [bacterium]|nr:aminopeptidase [bacterium]RQV96012.1 MAG: aminopeptidase [bacterium]
MVSLKQAIRSGLKDCLNVHQHEKVLIIADEPLSDIGFPFYQEANRLNDHSTLVLLPKISNNNNIPDGVASLMASSDVVILTTSRSLSHTKARRHACQCGARIASLPNIKADSLIRTLTGNYKSMINKSRKLADILTIGRSAHLTTPAGTNLIFSLVRMRGYADTGIIHEAGQFSNLPAGEGCTAPVQGSTQGILMVDGSFPILGKINTPVRMTIKDGHVIRISGGKEADTIRKLLRPFGRWGRNIAELGIGTNPRAQFTGCTLEDEKVVGTVHVALGNNISFGGKVNVDCHFDCILLKPTLIIDGKKILENGELQV